MFEPDNFILANQMFGNYVSQIEANQWRKPIVSNLDCDVKELVRRVIHSNLVFVATLKRHRYTPDIEFEIQDPVGEWHKTAQAAERALLRVGDLTSIADKPQSEQVSLENFINLQLIERTVYAWDLRNAIDSPDELNPRVVETAYASAQKLSITLPKQQFFGEHVAVSNDAPILHKLLALSGRQED